MAILPAGAFLLEPSALLKNALNPLALPSPAPCAAVSFFEIDLMDVPLCVYLWNQTYLNPARPGSLHAPMPQMKIRHRRAWE
jgi:hypothetical protein